MSESTDSGDGQFPAAMTSPLPAFSPGKPVVVWSGAVHRLGNNPDTGRTVHGELHLVWRRKFSLEWHLQEEAATWRHHDWGSDDVQFGFEYAGVVTPVPIVYADRLRGWTNGGALGRVDVGLTEVVGSLINLPNILGSRMIRDLDTGQEWTGRFETTAAGWQVTIDSTPDWTAEFAQVRRDESAATSHVLRLARFDGATFNTAEAESVLYALQLALSFAVGYWVGIAAPVGKDAAGRAVWTNVRAPHTGRAQRGSGWWIDSRPDDLAMLLNLFLSAWGENPAPTDVLRFATTSSILGNADGFVEQRLTAAVAALETLSWTTEVVEGAWPENQWNRDAARRLRRLLALMSVDATFKDNSPGATALATYGRAEQHHDLAKAVIEVRHRITHPKPERNIYAHEGLLLEAWRHAAFWLELAILRRIGYTGRVANRTIPRRWIGTSERVPWDRGADHDE